MGPFYTIAENELYQIFIQVAQVLQSKHELESHEIAEATKQLKLVYTTYPWRNLDVYDGVDFDDLRKCCGYLYRYATCHSTLTRFVTSCWFLENTSPILLANLFSRRHSLRVVSAGGGSGNDLLGFCSAIQNVPWRNFKRLELTVVDQKGGWEEVFDQVLVTAKCFPGIGCFLREVKLVHHFVKADLACDSIDAVKKADLILMVKVLSNATTSQKSSILENVFTSMKSGSMFFYVDTDALTVRKKAILMDNMEILSIKYSDVFFHSICAPLVNMISHSTYEVCVLYKN